MHMKGLPDMRRSCNERVSVHTISGRMLGHEPIQHRLSEWRRVRQDLQHAVEEAGVAQVLQPRTL
jgi:hypothetical protein